MMLTRKIKILFFLIVFFFVISCGSKNLQNGSISNLESQAAISPVKDGNGGKGVICGDNKIEMLDFYEAKYEKRNMNPDLGGLGLSVQEKVEIAIKRLERFDKDRADLYRSWARTFLDEAVTDHEYDLPDINDYGYIQLHRGCKVVQIAEQREPRTSLDYRYHVDSRYWQSRYFDDDNKAGLILHEIIFRDLLARGHTNSIETRHFVGLISSRVMDNWDEKRFRQEMLDRFLDEYVYAYIPPWVPNTSPPIGNSVTYVDRYFRGLSVSYLDAVEFCRSLPGESNLAYFDSRQREMFKPGSAIRKIIIGQDGNGDAIFWVFNYQNPEQLYSYRRGEPPDLKASPGDKHEFICEQILE